MKAKLTKARCRLSGEDYYYEIELLIESAPHLEQSTGSKLHLRLSDYEYSQLAWELTGKEDAPHHHEKIKGFFQQLVDQINVGGGD